MSRTYIGVITWLDYLIDDPSTFTWLDYSNTQGASSWRHSAFVIQRHNFLYMGHLLLRTNDFSVLWLQVLYVLYYIVVFVLALCHSCAAIIDISRNYGGYSLGFQWLFSLCLPWNSSTDAPSYDSHSFHGRTFLQFVLCFAFLVLPIVLLFLTLQPVWPRRLCSHWLSPLYCSQWSNFVSTHSIANINHSIVSGCRKWHYTSAISL